MKGVFRCWPAWSKQNALGSMRAQLRWVKGKALRKIWIKKAWMLIIFFQNKIFCKEYVTLLCSNPLKATGYPTAIFISTLSSQHPWKFGVLDFQWLWCAGINELSQASHWSSWDQHFSTWIPPTPILSPHGDNRPNVCVFWQNIFCLWVWPKKYFWIFSYRKKLTLLPPGVASTKTKRQPTLITINLMAFGQPILK